MTIGGPGEGSDRPPPGRSRSAAFSVVREHRSHAQARMIPSGSDWIFDGYTNVGDSCLFAPTDQQAPLL